MQLQAATLDCLKKTRRGPAERTLRVARGRCDWCVRERWRTAILGPKSPNWFQLHEDPRAELVKSGHQRSIWRVRLENEACFAKLYEISGPKHSFRGAIAARSAECEFRALLRAEACGVPVVKSLAVGLCDGAPRHAVVITLECPHAVRLGDAWQQEVQDAKPSRRRRNAEELIRRSAALFSIAHEAGFIHPDAHPGNVLVGRGVDDEPIVVFADVKDARFRDRPLTLEQSLRQLAHLDQYFQRCATRTQRLRFLRRFLAACPSFGKTSPSAKRERAALAQLARIKQRHAERLARRRDRRLFTNGKYFANVDLPDGWRATLVLSLERRHVFPEQHVPDRSLDDWRDLLPTVLDASRSYSAEPEPAPPEPTAAGAIEVAGLRAVAIRYPNSASRFLHTLLGNPQGRIFAQCHRCRHRDRPAELVLGYLEHRAWGLVDETMLLYPVPPPSRPTPRSRRSPTAAGAVIGT